MMLQTFDLCKNYGAKPVLSDINLSISAGEIFGLLGPNGAGKSTLIKLATGLIWPTGGSVEINGHDVHREHAMAMERLGAIIEWPAFYPDLSARKNLQILTGQSGTSFQRKLEKIADFVEISRYLDEKTGTFSTGMKQRLGIALALLPDSEFVILDEPTNGLDPNGIVEIRQIISEFNRSFGTTVLLSSHLLGEIEQICDRVAIIHQGKLAACGSLDELLQGGNEFDLVCDRMAEAVFFLKNKHISCEYSGGNAIRVKGAQADIAAINRLLVEADYQVFQLKTVHHSLEEFFLKKVGEHVA